MTVALDVWWGTTLVATVHRHGRRIATRYEPGAPMLTVAMPWRTRPYGEKESRPFFHGLLPEGETRRAIAYDLGLGTQGGDDVELLAALGRDCAGALVILPAGSPAPAAMPGALEPLSDAEVARRIRDLPLNPLGVDGRVRVSLPGVQNKILLARAAGGGWALPVDGAPSTHILKPEMLNFPGSVDNELLCQTVAAAAGVPAARTSKAVFDGMPVLVSERFDRHVAADGAVTRLHQEDACQALSVLTVLGDRKYQADPRRPPSFRGVARVLDQWGDPGSRDALIDQMALSVVLGNADLHGKNLTLVHRDGLVALSPVYDLMSTTGLPRPVSPTMGLFVNGKRDINAVTAEDLVEEAGGWGIRRPVAAARVHGLLERLPDAIEEAADEIGGVPGSLIDHVLRRAVDAREGSVGVQVAPAPPTRRPPATGRCGSMNTKSGKPCRNPAGCSVPGHQRR